MALRAFELDPQSRSAAVSLATAYELRGHHEQALALAQRIVDLYPDYTQGYRLMGRINAFTGQLSEGLVWMNRQARLDPASPFVLFGNLIWLELGEVDRVEANDGVFPGDQGEWRDDTCFVNIVAWRELAERCGDKLKKGSAVLVEGRLQSRSWETEDGQKRSTIEVSADRVQFLDRNRDGQGGAPAYASGGETRQEGGMPADDLPF